MHWWSQPICQFPQEFQARYLVGEKVKVVNKSEQEQLWFILFWKEYSVSSFILSHISVHQLFFNMKLSYCITDCVCVLTHLGTCRERKRASDCPVSHPVLMIRTELWSLVTTTIALWTDESSLQPLVIFFFKL